jgi:hypothetical protein
VTKRTRPDAGFVAEQADRMRFLLQERGALSQDDLEYLVQATAKLKDERLKACIAELIGWGDDERAEVETFVAIAIEILKTTNTSKIREAARVVNLNVLMREIK